MSVSYTHLDVYKRQTLPYLETQAEIRRRRRRRIAIFLAVVLGIAALLWAVNSYYMPLDLLVDGLIKQISWLPGLAPSVV